MTTNAKRNKNHKVLVVSPHMDDEVLGMGGTIMKHVAYGDHVHVIIVANRVYEHSYDEDINTEERNAVYSAKKILGYQDLSFLGLPDERLDNCIQDVLMPLENIYDDFLPDIIYCCFYGDNNQDHRAVFDAVRILARPSSTHKVSRFLVYEVPSSTEQSPPLPGSAFQPNFYVNISESINNKINAIKCYEKESRTYPHPRSSKAVSILAQKRGIEVGFDYAEAFIILRDQW